MRRLWSALLLLAACGDPSGPESRWVRLELRPEGPANVLVGEELKLSAFFVDETDQRSTMFDTLTVVVRTPTVAAVDGSTVTLLAAGSTWVVGSAATFSDSVLIHAREFTGEFHVTLIFADDVPQRWRDELLVAAARWEQVIGGELAPAVLNTSGGDCPTPPDEPLTPPLTGEERGVRVYVGQSGRFPKPTYVEAVGGPCLQRPLPAPTTIFGAITLNRDHPVSGIPDARLRYVAHHELGHVLGLVGVVQGLQPPWYDTATGEYWGAMALEACRRIVGSFCRELHFDGGSHWGFDQPVADVMNAANGIGQISTITIGALMDLGYPTRWSGAGPY